MTTGTIIYIIANGLLGSWLASCCLLNPLLQFIMNRKWRSVDLELISMISLIVILLTHALLYVLLCLFYDAPVAALASAALLLNWSLLAYFNLQRYADTGNRPGFVLSHPSFLPICLALSIASATVAVVLYARWYYLPIIAAAWVVYGICCAELAIAKLKARGYTRDLAYSALTREGLKLRSFYFGARYPFP